MMRKLDSRFWQRLCWLAFGDKTKQARGFTLLELLVSLAIGSVIVYLMLFAVVELLKTNQREAARSDTQRDLQSALDYIARDLREAVYIYDGNCLRADKVASCPSQSSAHTGLLSYLPQDLNRPEAAAGAGTGANNIPVLAFWRVDPLPDNVKTVCQNRAADFSLKEIPLELKGIPCVSSRMYTLVVYSLRLNPANDTIWKGRARITRYTLPQYGTTVALTPGTPTSVTTGWTSPIAKGATFPAWPLIDNRTPTDPTTWVRPTDYSKEVLIDFVDDQPVATGDVSCPALPATATNQDYVLTPNYITTKRRGFYACINVTKSNSLTEPYPVNQPNQEVVVYINGNAAGRPGIPRNGNLVIPMETRVLIRGALKKSS
jgi:prepilin-type N-terminal cleavage/methylation domain-containing protein